MDTFNNPIHQKLTSIQNSHTVFLEERLGVSSNPPSTTQTFLRPQIGPYNHQLRIYCHTVDLAPAPAPVAQPISQPFNGASNTAPEDLAQRDKAAWSGKQAMHPGSLNYSDLDCPPYSARGNQREGPSEAEPQGLSAKPCPDPTAPVPPRSSATDAEVSAGKPHAEAGAVLMRSSSTAMAFCAPAQQQQWPEQQQQQQQQQQQRAQVSSLQRQQYPAQQYQQAHQHQQHPPHLQRNQHWEDPAGRPPAQPQPQPQPPQLGSAGPPQQPDYQSHPQLWPLQVPKLFEPQAEMVLEDLVQQVKTAAGYGGGGGGRGCNSVALFWDEDGVGGGDGPGAARSAGLLAAPRRLAWDWGDGGHLINDSYLGFGAGPAACGGAGPAAASAASQRVDRVRPEAGAGPREHDQVKAQAEGQAPGRFAKSRSVTSSSPSFLSAPSPPHPYSPYNVQPRAGRSSRAGDQAMAEPLSAPALLPLSPPQQRQQELQHYGYFQSQVQQLQKQPQWHAQQQQGQHQQEQQQQPFVQAGYGLSAGARGPHLAGWGPSAHWSDGGGRAGAAAAGAAAAGAAAAGTSGGNSSNPSWQAPLLHSSPAGASNPAAVMSSAAEIAGGRRRPSRRIRPSAMLRDFVVSELCGYASDGSDRGDDDDDGDGERERAAQGCLSAGGLRPGYSLSVLGLCGSVPGSGRGPSCPPTRARPGAGGELFSGAERSEAAGTGPPRQALLQVKGGRNATGGQRGDTATATTSGRGGCGTKRRRSTDVTRTATPAAAAAAAARRRLGAQSGPARARNVNVGAPTAAAEEEGGVSGATGVAAGRIPGRVPGRRRQRYRLMSELVAVLPEVKLGEVTDADPDQDPVLASRPSAAHGIQASGGGDGSRRKAAFMAAEAVPPAGLAVGLSGAPTTAAALSGSGYAVEMAANREKAGLPDLRGPYLPQTDAVLLSAAAPAAALRCGELVAAGGLPSLHGELRGPGAVTGWVLPPSGAAKLAPTPPAFGTAARQPPAGDAAPQKAAPGTVPGPEWTATLYGGLQLEPYGTMGATASSPVHGAGMLLDLSASTSVPRPGLSPTSEDLVVHKPAGPVGRRFSSGCGYAQGFGDGYDDGYAYGFNERYV